MAYIEIVRVDEPQTLYCATFFLGKAGNVAPGGYWDTVEQAMGGLVHTLASRDLKSWAPNVKALTEGVVKYMAEHSSLTWARFEVPETATAVLEPAIQGMTAGCSIRRIEEYGNTPT